MTPGLGAFAGLLLLLTAVAVWLGEWTYLLAGVILALLAWRSGPHPE